MLKTTQTRNSVDFTSKITTHILRDENNTPGVVAMVECWKLEGQNRKGATINFYNQGKKATLTCAFYAEEMTPESEAYISSLWNKLVG